MLLTPPPLTEDLSPFHQTKTYELERRVQRVEELCADVSRRQEAMIELTSSLQRAARDMRRDLASLRAAMETTAKALANDDVINEEAVG
jgi:hypothetical protein